MTARKGKTKAEFKTSAKPSTNKQRVTKPADDAVAGMAPESAPAGATGLAGVAKTRIAPDYPVDNYDPKRILTKRQRELEEGKPFSE